MGADENVGALEDPGVVHDGLRGGRRELLRRRAVHRHGARGLRAREELRHGDGRSEPHGPLGTVLVAVEVAAGAAQRVVLDDDAEVRAGRALAVARHERRLETRPAGLDVEAVGGEIVGEDLHRALFLPAGLRVTRDVVGHGQELPVHQVFGAGDHGVAPRVARPCEPRDGLRQGGRAAALACGFADVFRPAGPEAVTITYVGDTILRRDSTVPFRVVVEAGGDQLAAPRLRITSSDASIFELTAGQDSLWAKRNGTATLIIQVESSILTDSVPTHTQPITVLP